MYFDNPLIEYLHEYLWRTLLVFILLVVPIEMIIHELGHFYFQRKYGIRVLFFKIGIFNIVKWGHKSGTDFILGVPLLKAESRGLGEVGDKKISDPESFYYAHRHPKERFVVAVAGVMATLLVMTACLIVYIVAQKNFGFPESILINLIFMLVAANEIINLFVPFKLPWKGGSIPNDAFVAIESLWHWYKFNKK